MLQILIIYNKVVRFIYYSATHLYLGQEVYHLNAVILKKGTHNLIQRYKRESGSVIWRVIYHCHHHSGKAFFMILFARILNFQSEIIFKQKRWTFTASTLKIYVVQDVVDASSLINHSIFLFSQKKLSINHKVNIV